MFYTAKSKSEFFFGDYNIISEIIKTTEIMFGRHSKRRSTPLKMESMPVTRLLSLVKMTSGLLRLPTFESLTCDFDKIVNELCVHCSVAALRREQ
jgi:hypothetical protein